MRRAGHPPKATPRRDGYSHWTRPRSDRGQLLRASIYRTRGPWNPSPTAGLWVLTASAKIVAISVLLAATYFGTSPGFKAYINGLPDVHLIASRQVTEDTVIYASDAKTILADLHPAGHQQYFQPL